MKTRAEVEALKSNWLSDPCWDIYNTEGYEEYYDELVVFQALKEAQWKEEHNFQLQLKSERMGVAGNLVLASYMELLEETINRLRLRIEKLESK